MRVRKNNISTQAGRENRIHDLAAAVQRIEREAEAEELSNYFEVLRYFQNPPIEEDRKAKQ